MRIDNELKQIIDLLCQRIYDNAKHPRVVKNRTRQIQDLLMVPKSKEEYEEIKQNLLHTATINRKIM